jgi:transcriptional regulator with XRE-family HTH domain
MIERAQSKTGRGEGWSARLSPLGLDRQERATTLTRLGETLRTLRGASNLSHGTLAVRTFLRHDQISAFERGVGTASLMAVPILADALGSTVSENASGLPPQTRQAMSARALSIITATPRIDTCTLAESIELPTAYVSELVRRLVFSGAIRGGPAKRTVTHLAGETVSATSLDTSRTIGEL